MVESIVLFAVGGVGILAIVIFMQYKKKSAHSSEEEIVGIVEPDSKLFNSL